VRSCSRLMRDLAFRAQECCTPSRQNRTRPGPHCPCHTCPCTNTSFALYCSRGCKRKPPLSRGLFSYKPFRGQECPRHTNLLLGRLGFGGIALRVFASETLDSAGGIHELLLAREKGMAICADFHADVALVGRARGKDVAAGAMDANFVIIRMDRCFHWCSVTSIQSLDSTGDSKDSARAAASPQFSVVSGNPCI